MDDKSNTPSTDWKSLLLYLGYDVSSREDLSRLAENSDWINKQRREYDKNSVLKSSIIVITITSIISAIVTLLINFILFELKFLPILTK